MSEFKTRSIISPILEFIKTCPFLDEYNIDLSNIGIQKVEGDKPEGSALDYVGSNQLSSTSDINNRGYSARQANFNLWLVRKSGYDFYREEVADFLWNFEQWIEHCQASELTPKISLDNNDKVEETMVADNGVFFADWENQDSSLYMIQLHIKYYNRY